MWGDESQNGLALDVTMKEAYSSGVGASGLTVGPRATMSEATLVRRIQVGIWFHLNGVRGRETGR